MSKNPHLFSLFLFSLLSLHNKMENPKGLQTFIDLDVARCSEQWSNIPELARRYKKYHPYESVLEFTARMEAEFILLARQIRQEIAVTDTNVSDLPSSTLPSPSSPPTAPAATATATTREWRNRQIINSIGSSSNLGNLPSSIGTASTAKSNYPEESDIFYQLDDPSNISLAPRLLPSQVQLVLVRLLDVIQRRIKSGELETPDDWQAQFSKIILARIYFETGRYEKALEWLQQVALRLEDVEAGYGLVLLVQARVIKGVCYEIQGNYSDALDCYLSALKVAEQHPQEQNKSLSFWLEECLYRLVLLQLRKKGPVKQTLKLMRTYLHYCSTHWPPEWRIHKRWIIFRHYIRYLTRAYQKGVYVPASPEDEYTSPASPILLPAQSVFSETGKTTLFECSAAALEETIQLMAQFQSLFAVFANEYHKKNPTDLNHRALELTNLLFTAHDTVGWGPTDYTQRTLRYLQKARKFTFNSVCTMRHLFYTLLKLGQAQEARLALIEYLGLLNVPHVLDMDCKQQQQYISDSSDGEDENAYPGTVAETIQHRLEYIASESLSSVNDSLLFWEKKLKSLQGTQDQEEDDLSSSEDNDQTPVSRCTPRKKPPVGSYESDMEFDVVKIIIAASQQLFGQHHRQGQEASALSDIAVALLEESEHLKKKKATQWRSLMAQSRRVQGVSYGLYASQCPDEKKRSMYLIESIASLKRASELDSRSWQTFYELGLQQAIVGDMLSAASSAKRSIKLRDDFIPSWHLLSLVQSSRQFHALPKSLQLIQAALGYHLNMVEDFGNEQDYGLVLSLDTEEGQKFFGHAVAYMKLRMTQVRLLEMLEGAEAALAVYPDLLDMYAKLSKKMSLETSFSPDAVVEIPKQSRRSSVLSSQRQDATSNASGSMHSFSSIIPAADSHKDKDSLNSCNFALPPPLQQQQLDNDILDLDNDHKEADFINSSALFKVYEEEKEKEASSEGKSPRNHRKSIKTSRQFMDDPLLSFPVANKLKKDKKEKRESKMPKNLLGAKSLFRSSSSRLSASKSIFVELPPDDETKNDNARNNTLCSDRASNSSLSTKKGHIKPSLSKEKLSSSFQQQQESLIRTSSAIERDAYFYQWQKQWQCILNRIWTMTSATYVNAKQYREAFLTIVEADQLTHGYDADVWNQIGTIAAFIHTEKGAQQQEQSVDAFKRALSIDPDHIASHISLASMYVEMGQFELAEQLLEKITRGLGWNQIEAWYLLSKVYTHQQNLLDAKNSLIYALKLSDTSPIESLDVLPRFV
ncbi:hypothetical protein BD408DRAFT_415282 [Parasitella parasitica]|nr:hypothetical protein BD408DRAFT_415282 [Parasitella parasitica]